MTVCYETMRLERFSINHTRIAYSVKSPFAMIYPGSDVLCNVELYI